MRDEILEIIAAEAGVLDISEDTPVSDLFDSLELVQLVIVLENYYHIDELPAAELQKIRTVKDVIEVVERHVKLSNAPATENIFTTGGPGVANKKDPRTLS